jgi:hypothetical protein
MHCFNSRIKEGARTSALRLGQHWLQLLGATKLARHRCVQLSYLAILQRYSGPSTQAGVAGQRAEQLQPQQSFYYYEKL